MMKEIFSKNLNPRSARLKQEYEGIMEFLHDNKYLSVEVIDRNDYNIPNRYLVTYNLRSITGVNAPAEETAMIDGNPVSLTVRKPIYGQGFRVKIEIPKDYPDRVTGHPKLYLLDTVWHPNVRFSGESKGRICIAEPSYDASTTILFRIIVVGEILSYRKYFAINTDPYPEDSEVAEWVRNEAEPMGWLAPDGSKPTDDCDIYAKINMDDVKSFIKPSQSQSVPSNFEVLEGVEILIDSNENPSQVNEVQKNDDVEWPFDSSTADDDIKEI